MKRRLPFFVALLIVTGLGLGTSYYEGAERVWVRDHGSGILYVMFWILLVLTLRPVTSPGRVAVIVLVLTCLVEFSQLIDAKWLNDIRKTWLGASLLGVAFKWSDLPYYAIGAIAGWGLARLLGAGPRA
jgi:hypothetical protein